MLEQPDLWKIPCHTTSEHQTRGNPIAIASHAPLSSPHVAAAVEIVRTVSRMVEGIAVVDTTRTAAEEDSSGDSSGDNSEGDSSEGGSSVQVLDCCIAKKGDTAAAVAVAVVEELAACSAGTTSGPCAS